MRTLFFLAVLALTSACPGGGGPCSSPEVLFPAARARASATDAGLAIDVSWQAPASVPAAFYASPRTSSTTSSLRLVDAGVGGAQLTSGPVAGELKFDLEYSEGPTRTCKHLGMDDTYVLSVTLPPVPTDGGTSMGTITTDTQLGAL